MMLECCRACAAVTRLRKHKCGLAKASRQRIPTIRLSYYRVLTRLRPGDLNDSSARPTRQLETRPQHDRGVGAKRPSAHGITYCTRERVYGKTETERMVPYEQR